MKNPNSPRPIGKCKGCCLNFKTFCKAGLAPKAEWNRGRCKSYNDRDLLEEILSRPVPTGARAARLRRQAKAVIAASEPHHNGVLGPGKMAGRTKRRAR